MNADTAQVVVSTVNVAVQQLADGSTDTAVAFVDGQLFIGVGYWLAPDVFSQAVSDQAAPAQRGVFTVPIVVNQRDSEVGFRPADGELCDTEHEELFILAFDLSDGLDVGRCRIDRDDAGAPSFGDIETFQGAVQVPPTAPGMSLVQALLPKEEKA